MKFTTVAVAALALALPAFAQDLSGLPACAQTPVIGAIGSSGCGLTDIKCICSNEAFISGLASQISKVCSPADVAATDAFAVKLCEGAGITLSVPAGGAAPATTSSSSSSSATATSNTTPPTTSTSTETPTSTEASGSSTAAASAATFTGAASVQKAEFVVAGLLGALGVAALL